jgi:hypothetical protein
MLERDLAGGLGDGEDGRMLVFHDFSLCAVRW